MRLTSCSMMSRLGRVKRHANEGSNADSLDAETRILLLEREGVSLLLFCVPETPNAMLVKMMGGLMSL